MLKTDTSLLRTEREGGTRNASVHDFHSLRVTWVTIALTGGVPLELVQKVTGHKTTDIVLKHYFQPGREAFREALQSAMPKLLTSSEKQKAESRKQKAEGTPHPASGHLLPSAEKDERDAEMREIIERVTPKSWKRDKARLLELVAER